MVTRREWYERVNDAWPEGPLPKLTAEEAVAAAKKLYRFHYGRSWTRQIKVTSGNRYSYVRGGIMYVNPDFGWKTLVHHLSHEFKKGGHGKDHALAEIRLIKEVIKRGWLDGALKKKYFEVKPEPPPKPEIDVKHERAVARLKRWESKAKRAATAIKKLKREIARYERKKKVLLDNGQKVISIAVYGDNHETA